MQNIVEKYENGDLAKPFTTYVRAVACFQHNGFRSVAFVRFVCDIVGCNAPRLNTKNVAETWKQCTNGEILLTIDVAKIKIRWLRVFACIFAFSRSRQFVYDEIK